MPWVAILDLLLHDPTAQAEAAEMLMCDDDGYVHLSPELRKKRGNQCWDCKVAPSAGEERLAWHATYPNHVGGIINDRYLRASNSNDGSPLCVYCFLPGIDSGHDRNKRGNYGTNCHVKECRSQ